MLYLFALLFQVLEEPYSLGNFAYMAQVLALILSETYLKERQGKASGQNVNLSKIYEKFPMELFVILKMTEARKLLRITDMYIYEIRYYFSWIFKSVVGISLTNYINTEI